MTLSTYDFEGANGAPISETGVTLQGAGTAAYDTSWSVSGSSCGTFTPTLNNARSARCVGTSGTVQSFQIFFKVPALPAAASFNGVANLRNTTPAVAARIKVDSTGVVGVEAGSTGFHAVSAALAAGTAVRLTLLVNVTTGVTTAKAYTGAGYTTQSGSTYTATLTYPSAAPIDSFDVGAVTTATSPIVIYTVQADYVQMDSANTSELTVPSGPTVTAVAGVSNQYPATGTNVTLTSSGSTTTGATYLWTPLAWPALSASPSISNTAGASPNVTLNANGRYTFQLTVTVGGTSATASVTVYVNAANFGVYSASGTWTNNGGASDIVAALNDTLATTYGQTQPAPAGDVETLVMNPAPLGAISVFISAYYANGPVTSRVVKVYKEDGTTLIYTNAAYAVGASDAEREVILDSTALAAIPALADRRALVVTMTDTV